MGSPKWLVTVDAVEPRVYEVETRESPVVKDGVIAFSNGFSVIAIFNISHVISVIYVSA